MPTKTPPASRSLFSRKDYETLRFERRRLNDLLSLFDKAEQCGVGCQHYREMRDELDRQLEKIELHFMTPPPK